MNQTQNVLSDGDSGALWSIILAAGEGTRLAAVTRLLYGREVPKQFAALDGDRTLLQRTMDRVGLLIPPERTVVVVAEDRRELAETQLAGYPGVQIICQPTNSGTGPGILLPMSLIRAQSPHAMVVVTPSDHYIPAPAAFVAAVERAVEVAPFSPSGLALLGADADSPAVDLGWIVPQDHAAAPEAKVDLIASFVEKPAAPVARKLFKEGGLWNTLVVIGSVNAFWRQARRHMPRQVAIFNRYVNALLANGGRPGSAADTLLTRLYRSLPPADFSRSVLQNAEGLAVVRLKGSGWCDCGTPERLLTCLDTTAERRYHLLREILHSVQADKGLRAVGNGA